MPLLARALGKQDDENGFTRERLERLLHVFAADLVRESGKSDPVDALFYLLKDAIRYREVLARLFIA